MLDPRDVCAVLVTRGDVNMQPIYDTLPYGEVVLWDNSVRPVDWNVFGRYMGIMETAKHVIYVQDDDCLVTCHRQLMDTYEPGVVVGNAEDNPDRLAMYHDTTLLGWGALFDRWLPFDAFVRYARHGNVNHEFMTGLGAEICFPMLSRTRTVVGGFEWLDEDGQVQHRDNRMWRQPGFYDELHRWLAEARRVRDLLAGSVAA